MNRLLPVVGLSLLLLVAHAANATPVTYTISNPDAALTGWPTPFGTATVNLLTPTSATLVISADESHANAYLFGGMDVVAFNINAGFSFGVSISGESNPMPGFTPSPASFERPEGPNVRFRIDDGFSHAATSISFVLTNGGTWGSSADVLRPNFLAGGMIVAVHVFICDANAALCNGTTGAALVSGFATNGPPSEQLSPIPEPASLVLLGTGLMGMAGFVGRRLS